MEIWHTADPVNPTGEVGWLGRLADQLAQPGALPALHVGTGDLPLALYARRAFAPTVRDEAGFRLRGTESFARERSRMLALDREGDAAFLAGAARASYDAARRMAEAADRGTSVDYPGYELARRLRLVARLVSGGFGSRIFHVELGGFDTHARQGPAHADLLRELALSLNAFQRDLEASGSADDVVTLVFSEFGRRARENGSRGTDHGAGAPAFLVGSGVRGGLYGTPPDLARLEEGDVPFTTDFRSIYRTLEERWLGLEPSSTLPGLDVLA